MEPFAPQEKPQPPIGIDLGTTYSVVAYLDASGRPTTVCNSTGDLLTPSALYVDDDAIIIGREAMKNCAFDPASYIDCFKRDMGRTTARRKLHSIDMPPEILSAFILERLKMDAERRLGPISSVVVTVPAFFDEIRRKATQDAGRLAGLNVIDIINEPTAAALAYGYRRGFLTPSEGKSSSTTQRFMVYDLGGGTFDVTILEIQGSQFRAVATDGDVFLGGKDFDERLVNYVAEQFTAAHGVDPRNDPRDAAQLWQDAQEAKHTLSERSKATIVCFYGGIRFRIDVTREHFEHLTSDLLERTATTSSLVVRQAGLGWSDIDQILLVGGSSRMPMVARMLRTVTGKEPDRSESPDEAVAHGAALYAGMLMGDHSTSQRPCCQLINVNSHSLGVVGIQASTGQRINVRLIPKNTQLPCHAVRKFKTARANQRSVKVDVVEGESERPEACIALGECVIRDLPHGLPQGSLVEVEYSYHANGRIAVSARVPSVRQSQHVEIRRTASISHDDLATWRMRLCGKMEPVPNPDSAAPPATVDPATAVLKRLDLLYRVVGQTALGVVLPETLHRSQDVARQASAELVAACTAVETATRQRQMAVGAEETIRKDAEVAKAKSNQHQAKTRLDFALLVLGRDCINAGYCPPGAAPQMKEIGKLRKV